jgi:hypothetical protein
MVVSCDAGAFGCCAGWSAARMEMAMHGATIAGTGATVSYRVYRRRRPFVSRAMRWRNISPGHETILFETQDFGNNSVSSSY